MQFGKPLSKNELEVRLSRKREPMRLTFQGSEDQRTVKSLSPCVQGWGGGGGGFCPAGGIEQTKQHAGPCVERTVCQQKLYTRSGSCGNGGISPFGGPQRLGRSLRLQVHTQSGSGALFRLLTLAWVQGREQTDALYLQTPMLQEAIVSNRPRTQWW